MDPLKLLRLARQLLSLLRRRLLVIAVFTAGVVLPPATVWLATRGHGAAHAVVSDPIRPDPGADELTTWRWADFAHRTVRLPIDQAIDRYVHAASAASP
jgi:hypothetical protein